MQLKYKYINNNSENLTIIFQGVIKIDDQLGASYDPKIISERHESYQYYAYMTENVSNSDFLFIQDSFSTYFGWYSIHEKNIIVESLSNKISDLISDKYKKVSMFGSSKGGYAALLYGTLIDKVTHIFSLVPQMDVFSYLSTPNNENDIQKFKILKNDLLIEKNGKKLNELFFNTIQKNSTSKQIFLFTSKSDDQYDMQLEYSRYYNLFLFEGNHSNFAQIHTSKILNLINSIYDQKETQNTLSIIIPTHNNGELLMANAMFSLFSSCYFKSLDIIIVDDASKDSDTLYVLDKLAKIPNIKVIMQGPIASGSASFPRNIGVDNSNSEYIYFLDPDDMIITENFDSVLNTKYTEDIIVCNKKCSNGWELIYNIDQKVDGITNLINNKLAPQSLGACIFKKKTIKENNIAQVKGAFGEDTLFFREFMYYAKSVVKVNVFLYLYHMDVENSATNNINISFFDKSFKAMYAEKQFFAGKNLEFEYFYYAVSSDLINWYFLKYLDLSDEYEKFHVMKELQEYIYVSNFEIYENSIMEKLYNARTISEFDERVLEAVAHTRFKNLKHFDVKEKDRINSINSEIKNLKNKNRKLQKTVDEEHKILLDFKSRKILFLRRRLGENRNNMR